MHPSCKVRKEKIHLVTVYGAAVSNIGLYLVHLCYQ